MAPVISLPTVPRQANAFPPISIPISHRNSRVPAIPPAPRVPWWTIFFWTGRRATVFSPWRRPEESLPVRSLPITKALQQSDCARPWRPRDYESHRFPSNPLKETSCTKMPAVAPPKNPPPITAPARPEGSPHSLEPAALAVLPLLHAQGAQRCSGYPTLRPSLTTKARATTLHRSATCSPLSSLRLVASSTKDDVG